MSETLLFIILSAKWRNFLVKSKSVVNEPNPRKKNQFTLKIINGNEWPLSGTISNYLVAPDCHWLLLFVHDYQWLLFEWQLIAINGNLVTSFFSLDSLTYLLTLLVLRQKLSIAAACYWVGFCKTVCFEIKISLLII